jgi:hypothetical protein
MLSIHLCLSLPSVSFPLAFLPITYTRSSSSPFMPLVLPTSSSSTLYFWLYLVKSTNYAAPCKFDYICIKFILRNSNICHVHHVCNVYWIIICRFLDNIFYTYRALVWARKVGISCTVYAVRMLYNKYFYSRYFPESSFTTAESIHLNILAVACGSDSTSQSLPRPPVPSLNPSSSVIMQKGDIYVLLPTTCKQTPVQSPVMHFPINADIPSTSL